MGYVGGLAVVDSIVVCSYQEYLAPIAAEERKIEEAEKATREEQERIAKALAEGNACRHPRHCI